MNDSVFALADELGPAKMVHLYEPAVGLKAVVAVDNVAIGPSIGGIRMAPDVSAEEAFRLARAMTLKNAAAGLSHGGGKAVIVADPRMARGEKERLIRAFAVAIRELGDYIPGPDMGTDETCMAWIHDEIGRGVGLPRELGGIPLDEIGATGWGLFHAIEVALPHCGFGLEGARFVIQGFGAVGMHAARFLSEHGAVLVAAATSQGTLHDPKGLDVARLIRTRAAGGNILAGGGAVLPREAVLEIDCDIWIPAARPDVVNESNVDRLRARLVAQGANIPCTPGAERRLAQRGVLVLPDFIANAGGVICAAVEYRGGSETVALDTIQQKIRANVAAMLDAAKREGRLPREAAVAMARQRVLRAMRLRRWGDRAA
ncbi:MAG: Glu/Leu/Phe/Val dehydrogenase [Candidatus Lambdaproteobacteria bacterium]|nr:Glu/Leu/Phe/Val dehydrogenase [Candidatus Lambdaproteobacteria bacterium]